MKEGASSLSGIFAGVESRLELIGPRAPGPACPVFLSCAWWATPKGRGQQDRHNGSTKGLPAIYVYSLAPGFRRRMGGDGN